MTTTKQTPTKSTKPVYIAYTVRNRDDQEDGFWTRIGVAFPHQDGKGINLLLECVPFDGRVTLRVPSEKPAKPE
ncbi:MAG TPA: hypothetical protein VH092_00200 [Urbifossiella sp.]|jgi:hypothetical protein|nr:hypothetical protein [Urbifossiella sp.]